MGKIGKGLELIANLTIILVGVLLVIVLIRNYVLVPKPPISTKPLPELRGMKLDIPGVRWEQSQQTLVMALRKDCRFCTESASFYQKLANNKGIRSRTHILAIFPHSESEGQQYLDSLGITIDDLKQVSLANIKVRGTPTLMLVNSKGVVTDAWFGKLPSDKEEEVIQKLL